MVIKTSLSDHAMLHGSDMNHKPEQERFQEAPDATARPVPRRKVNPPLTSPFAFTGKAFEKTALFGMEG
jgi:hypothetical protein